MLPRKWTDSRADSTSAFMRISNYGAPDDTCIERTASCQPTATVARRVGGLWASGCGSQVRAALEDPRAWTPCVSDRDGWPYPPECRS